MARAWMWAGMLAGLVAVTAWGQPPPSGLTREQANQRAQALEHLGRKMFFDPSLSASGKLACASCHDPAYAYGPPNGLPVQAGGPDLGQWGRRAAPSLKYLQAEPEFTEHYFEAEYGGSDSVDAGPTGGLTWDGRVDRVRDQARIPLLSPYEMANRSPAAVVGKARRAEYAGELARLTKGSSADSVFATILEALEAWQQDYREFYPYSSKYDAFLAGKAALTGAEERGLRWFNDPEKGDCARCHISTEGENGTPPQFTDYALVALGVPRNRKIPANADGNWYDLGLCGPERTDLREKSGYCGRFKTPTLRNVALRRAFFHNGVFHSLREVVEFYALRDTAPEKFYPRDIAGEVVKFDDLPPAYRVNVEQGPPFGRTPGGKPALTEAEIEDVVAFLGTLTDGYGGKE